MTTYTRLKNQAAFFRKIVRQIAGHKRHTREQRLAAAALGLWEEIEDYRRTGRRHRRPNEQVRRDSAAPERTP